MTSLVQQPASLDLLCVAGDPLSVTFDITLTDANGNPIAWTDFTAPVITLVDPTQTPVTTAVPTITTNTGQLVAAWAGTQTAVIAAWTSVRWSLSAAIGGTSYTLVAGTLTVVGPTTPGVSTTTTQTLTVQVGTATATLTIVAAVTAANVIGTALGVKLGDH